MVWVCQEMEKQKFVSVNRGPFCRVKGCKGKKQIGRPFCGSHDKRIQKRGTLLSAGGTTAIPSGRTHERERRDPYGQDNSSKSDYVAELIKRVDEGE